MVQETHGDNRVTWKDGTRLVVEQYRCLGCMALEMTDRDRHDPDFKPIKGVYAPSDGLRRTVRIERD